MNSEDLKKYVELNLSYLCLYTLEGELIDAFLNLKFVNECYIEQHARILESSAENCVIVFRDVMDKGLSGAVMENMIDKVNLVIYNPDAMLQYHPEFFMEIDE